MMPDGLFQPLLPLWLSLPLVVVVAGLLVRWARQARRAGFSGVRRTTCMRMMVLAVLLGVLLGPTTSEPREAARVVEPELMVLLDTSASMLTEDVHGRSRLTFAADTWLGGAMLEAMARTHRVRLWRFDASAVPIDAAMLPTLADTVGDETRLGRAIDTMHAAFEDAAPGSAMLMLSDGHDTTGRFDARMLPEGVPVLTVPLGSGFVPPNVFVTATPLQPFLFPREQGLIRARIRAAGVTDWPTQLHLEQGDEQRAVAVELGDRDVVVDLPIQHDRPGTYRYDLFVPPLPGELNEASNRISLFIRVHDEPMEVLLIEGEPGWDMKFLAQSLRRDPRLGLTQMTQLGPDRMELLQLRSRVDVMSSPTSVEGFARFDAVVLGRSVDRVLNSSARDALAEAVRDRGVALIASRGRPLSESAISGDAMLDLLPAEAEADVRSLRSDAAPTGAVAEEVLRDAGLSAWPGGMPSIPVEHVASHADTTVMARLGTSHPLVLMRTVGAGRVLMVTAEDLWRWSLQAPVDVPGPVLLDAWWMRLIQIAVGRDEAAGADWRLSVEPIIQQLGQPVTITLASRTRDLADGDVIIALADPQGQTRTLAFDEPVERPARRITWQVEPQSPGEYTVTATAPSGDEPERQTQWFAAYDLREERLDPSARPSVLEAISEHTGGVVLSPDEPAQLTTWLARQIERSPMLRVERTPWWPSETLLILLLVWLGCEWLLRKHYELS